MYRVEYDDMIRYEHMCGAARKVAVACTRTV
jgi:hypothetical protein